MTILRVPINIAFPGAGSPGANIWHIRTVTGPGGAELAEANTLIGYIRAFYFSNVTEFPATTVFSIGTVTEEETSREISPTFATVTGTGVGSAPQALAMVVTWRTEIAARRGRGRTFVGPLSTATMQNDGTPSTSSRNAIVTAASTLVSASLAYGNGAIGVYGYQNAKSGGADVPRDPDDPKIFRDFTGSAVRDLFGVLRSRRD
jgi:hypothetical protein